MKERTIIKSIVGLLAALVILGIGNTDLIYIGASLGFFGICAAYAEWCERL